MVLVLEWCVIVEYGMKQSYLSMKQCIDVRVTERRHGEVRIQVTVHIEFQIWKKIYRNPAAKGKGERKREKREREREKVQRWKMTVSNNKEKTAESRIVKDVKKVLISSRTLQPFASQWSDR